MDIDQYYFITENPISKTGEIFTGPLSFVNSAAMYEAQLTQRFKPSSLIICNLCDQLENCCQFCMGKTFSLM